MEIKGRHLIEGVPKTITITDEEIRESLAETVNVIVDAVRVALERTPPELSADIVDRGIVLTGGGSLLKNLDKRSAGGDGPAGRHGRGSAVDRRARRREDAVELRAPEKDLPRLSRRTAFLLLALSLGHVLLISAQVQSSSGLPVMQTRRLRRCSRRCSRAGRRGRRRPFRLVQLLRPAGRRQRERGAPPPAARARRSSSSRRRRSPARRRRSRTRSASSRACRCRRIAARVIAGDAVARILHDHHRSRHPRTACSPTWP